MCCARASDRPASVVGALLSVPPREARFALVAGMADVAARRLLPELDDDEAEAEAVSLTVRRAMLAVLDCGWYGSLMALALIVTRGVADLARDDASAPWHTVQ